MFDQKPTASPPGDLPENNNQPAQQASQSPVNAPNSESALPTIADMAVAKDGGQGGQPAQSQPSSSQSPSPGGVPSQNSATPPVEDIFAKTDQGDNANVNRPMQPGQAGSMPNDPVSENMLYNNKSTGPKKVIMAILILVVVAIVAGAGWWAFNYFSSQQGSGGESNLNDSGNNSAVVNQNSNIANSNANADANNGQTEIIPPANQEVVVPPIDTDSDGLSDDREQELGTDISKADTDSDGLSDWAEESVYNTDPLNPDTDGDSYLDGNEVINNYDPNLPGNARLYDVP